MGRQASQCLTSQSPSPPSSTSIPSPPSLPLHSLPFPPYKKSLTEVPWNTMSLLLVSWLEHHQLAFMFIFQSSPARLEDRRITCALLNINLLCLLPMVEFLRRDFVQAIVRSSHRAIERSSDRATERSKMIITRAPDVHSARRLVRFSPFCKTSRSNPLPVLNVDEKYSLQTTQANF